MLNRETVSSEQALYQLILFAREFMLHDTELHTPEWDIERTNTERKHVTNTLTVPEIDGLHQNPNIIKEIETLGAAILDEAFECLGDEADEYIQLLREDPENNIEKVCNWLIKRLHEIDECAEITFENTEDDPTMSLQYPPIRISPKIIGRFPENKISPTCLGKSIIAGSFFKMAGLPTLHAGIAISQVDAKGFHQFNLLKKITAELGEAKTDTLPKITTTMQENLAQRFNHRGFHVAILTQAGNKWVQFDPNYDAVIISHPGQRYTSDLTYYFQNVFRKLRTTDDQHKTISHEYTDHNNVFSSLVCDMENKYPFNKEELENIILTSPPEELYYAIVHYVFQPFLTQKAVGAKVTKEDANLDDFAYNLKFTYYLSGISIEQLQELFHNILADFIFTDSVHSVPESQDDVNLQPLLEQCLHDDNYRKRHVEYLEAARTLLVTRLHSSWSDNPKARPEFHSGLHIGSLDYRVGINVLSDIAIHYEDELPLSTWLSYWPCDTSLVAHAEKITSPAQIELARAAIKHILTGKELLITSTIMPILVNVLSNLPKKDTAQKNATDR